MTPEEQKFWFERLLFSSVLFIKLLLIFRSSRSDWPYTIVFCITAIAGWFALISPAYDDRAVRQALTYTGFCMSIVTTITTGAYIIREKADDEGWIRPTLRNFIFFMLCALTIFFILFRFAPIGWIRYDAQLDSLKKEVKRSERRQQLGLNRNKKATEQVDTKADTVIARLRKVEKLLVPTIKEIKGFRRDVREAKNSANKAQQEVVTVRKEQQVTQEKVEVVTAKVDTVKAAVQAVLPDTTAVKDTTRPAAVPAAVDTTGKKKRGWWPLSGRRKKG